MVRDDCYLSSLTLTIGIGESDWTFKNLFMVTDTDLAETHVDLVFEGLDTYATVTLVSGCQYHFLLHVTHRMNTRTVK